MLESILKLQGYGAQLKVEKNTFSNTIIYLKCLKNFVFLHGTILKLITLYLSLSSSLFLMWVWDVINNDLAFMADWLEHVGGPVYDLSF